ncbi:hypothetical protein JCM33374_g4565 [Metschnikowia sp. JCM 33374]|nr:hypothetical protein JCM33374_g4565 [Metschnikowia sp. JCM 33374]
MDSEELYDEFGNFLGDANDSDADSDFEASAQPGALLQASTGDANNTDSAHSPEDDVMEEASGYPDTVLERSLSTSNSLAHSFPEVETIVVDPTAEGSDEPVIRPMDEKTLRLEYKNIDNSSLPHTTYCKKYLCELTNGSADRIRNVAVVGNLHTGKTSLIDKFVTETHPGIGESKKDAQQSRPLRYSDTHTLENERGLSMNACAVSLLLQDSRHRSYAVNILDCPGHPDFRDDVYASLGVAEGVVFVVDVVEGLTMPDKKLMTDVIRKNLPMVVVLNKFDRLLLELRLPPRDAFQKLKYVLADINAHIHHNEYAATYTQEKLMSPLKENVVFASHTLRTSFTLSTWSRFYTQPGKAQSLEEAQFRMLLWGDVYFENGKFTKKPSATTVPSCFEQFILEPIYKLVSHTLVSEPGDKKLPQLLWDQFGVSLHKSSYKKDPQTLLKEVFATIFPDSKDFVHSVIQSIPSPQGAHTLRTRGVDTEKLGPNDAVAEVFKMNLRSDAVSFDCLTKVHRGAFKVGEKVSVVGSGNAHQGDEIRTEQIHKIFLPVGRYNIEVEQAPEGSIVILHGICGSISKNATLFSKTPTLAPAQLPAIHNLDSGKSSFYKVAVECENPSELPKLVAALQKLTKTYLSAVTKLEESGEHVLLAPGELYLDCFLHDLRYTGEKYLSIKVSDPMVKFAETCMERSVTKISASTPSKMSSIAITAEPVGDKRLLSAIEKGRISLAQPKRVTAKILKEEFEWDALAARSLWCFGPQDMQNPSMLLDDTIDGETDKDSLVQAKEAIVAGFQLGVNEGPLCDEPIRRTKFKILDAVLGGNVQHSGGQIIPMTRNAVHTGFLTAAPRLLEPMYRVHVTCTYRSVTAVHTILEKRRGWAVSEVAIPATQLYEIEGCVPVIDSVGLDTDMRLYTQGQAFCSLEFFRWDVVPGDPLDKLCALPQMKPVPRASLARDFVIKTRKRKGLSGEPNLQKYIEPELYSRLKQSGIVN